MTGRGIASVLVGVLALAGVLGGCTPDVSDRDISTVDLAAVRKMIEKEKPGSFQLLDARPPERFAAGRLPGAINMPITMLPDGAKLPIAIANSKTVVVYGENAASGLARGVTKRIYVGGQKGVRLFEDGYEAWTQAGLPIEKSDSGKQPAAGTSEGKGN